MTSWSPGRVHFFRFGVKRTRNLDVADIRGGGAVGGLEELIEQADLVIMGKSGSTNRLCAPRYRSKGDIARRFDTPVVSFFGFFRVGFKLSYS